jgi:hypothetical protein
VRNDLLVRSLTLLLLAGCSRETPSSDRAPAAPAAVENESRSSSPTTRKPPLAETPLPKAKALPPVAPPAPGTPGGLPDDRTPLSEAPFTPTSAQGAVSVVQTYYALLERGRYREAWKLWSGGGEASGMTASAFAASFGKYAEYHAQVGAPGQMEGAAGSSYVEVPVVIYGRLRSGEEVHMNGPVTLRRVNDVPGSTAEQRQWHIRSSGVGPSPR